MNADDDGPRHRRPAAEGEGTPSLPDEVWQQFLQDSERVIRGPVPGGQDERARMEAVGEIWYREEPERGPSWRDMDARARRRRTSQVLGAVAAIIVVAGAVSQLSSGSGDGVDSPADTLSTQSGDVGVELPAVLPP